MRTVFWEDTLGEAEMNSMDWLRPFRLWTIIGGGRKEAAVSTAAARPALPHCL